MENDSGCEGRGMLPERIGRGKARHAPVAAEGLVPGVGNTAATKPDPNCAVPIGLLAAIGPTI